MKSLYSQKDVTDEKNKMLINQNNIDPITKEIIPPGQSVLDHDHVNQNVRSALHRQTNAFEGKVVNAFVRYLSWSSNSNLPTVLRNLADYLEKDYSKNPYHPGWKKKVQTEFNKLNAVNQQIVLQELYDILGSEIPVDKKTNGTIRKAQFKKLCLNRELGYVIITNVLTNVKGPNET